MAKFLELRKLLKKTQEDISKTAGISLQRYQRYENGKYEKILNEIRSLAKIYGVSVDFLLSDNDIDISTEVASVVRKLPLEYQKLTLETLKK